MQIDFTPYYQMISPQWQLQNQLAKDAMAQRQARMNVLAPGLKGQEQLNQYQQVLAQKELQAQQQAQQEAYLKSLSEAGRTLQGLVGTFGRRYVIDNWDNFKNLHPMFQNANPKDITPEGGYAAKDEQGNVLGHFVVPPGGDRAIFVKAERPQEQKSLTTEQLTELALTENLGRKPTATEIKNQLQKDRLEQMKASRSIIRDYSPAGDKTFSGTDGSNFASWSPETKEWWYEYDFRTGQKPYFGMGAAATKSRAEYARGYADYLRKKGISGLAAGTEQAEFKANARALADISKREQLIKTFTNRIDANIKLFESHRKEFESKYPRLVNIPLNKARQLMGSGDWAALNALMQSISSEVAKVETGSLGIAGVAEGARAVWDKIHDPNLSYSELMKVLNMSRELGQTAAQAMAEQKGYLKESMRTTGREIISGTGRTNDPLGIRGFIQKKETQKGVSGRGSVRKKIER